MQNVLIPGHFQLFHTSGHPESVLQLSTMQRHGSHHSLNVHDIDMFSIPVVILYFVIQLQE